MCMKVDHYFIMEENIGLLIQMNHKRRAFLISKALYLFVLVKSALISYNMYEDRKRGLLVVKVVQEETISINYLASLYSTIIENGDIQNAEKVIDLYEKATKKQFN